VLQRLIVLHQDSWPQRTHGVVAIPYADKRTICIRYRLAVDTELIDRALTELQSMKRPWATLDIHQKLAMLSDLRTKAADLARPWVEAAVAAKGISMDSNLAGEEWLGGPYGLIDAINSLEATLAHIANKTDPLKGFNVYTRPDGQVVVDVLPVTPTDRLLFSGSSASVWMQPDVTEQTLPETIGEFYKQDAPRGAVSVVLGAGNVASIAVLDVLHKLYNEGEVVILKMNPVNDYLGPVFEAIYEDFVDAGFVRFVYGDASVGAYLTNHRDTDTIHITGGGATYNRIRYGDGDEGEANRLSDSPTNAKPITAELGGVSPTIVVPGPWSKGDIKHHAENVVTQKMNNSGYNCVAAQVLVLPESWDLTDAFVEEVRRQLSELGDRPAYYPGSDDRCEVLVDEAGTVETFGEHHKRYLITGLDATDVDDHAFTSEYFAPALAVVTLPAPDVPTYLVAATEFSNNVLVGTLAASIIIHPKTEKAHRAAFDTMVADLEYGGLGVNTWSANVYLLSRCPWGAFPGNRPSDVGSGIGTVHNTMMFGRSQKAVARAPFAPSHRSFAKGEVHLAPKPIFFVGNPRMAQASERLVEYSGSGKTSDLVGVLRAALVG
ncbi:MAG: aldehyde dehydrogenase family protein, partial [Acidimicrobiia bacterium]